MNTMQSERDKTVRCADLLSRVASLIRYAVSLELHPSLDWEQLITCVAEEMLSGATGAMWDDPVDQLAALTHVTDALKRQVQQQEAAS